MHASILNFLDQLRILPKGLKILILFGFNNFHSWTIQEPRRSVSFALCFMCEMNVVEVQANGKSQVWSLSAETSWTTAMNRFAHHSNGKM